MDDPTAVVSALKELDKFLEEGTPRRMDYSRYGSKMGVKSSAFADDPRLKLSFGETMMEDSRNGIDELSCDEENFLKRQRDMIAGFDVTKRIRDKDVQVIEANSIISALEAKIITLETRREEAKIEYENELHSLRKRKMRDMDQISDLKLQLKQSASREQEAKEAALQAKKSAEETSTSIEYKMNSMRTEGMNRIGAMNQEISQLRNRLITMQSELETKESALAVLQAESEKYEEQRQRDREELIIKEKKVMQFEDLKLEQSKSQIKIKELECQIKEYEIQGCHKDTLDKSFRRVIALEKEIEMVKGENTSYKLTSVNVDLLEEKLRAAESKIRITETRCSELTEENGSLKALKTLSEEVETAVKAELDLNYMPPVGELEQRLRDLRKGDRELSRSIDQLKESLKSHEKTRLAQNETIARLKTEKVATLRSSLKNQEMVKRLQRKLLMMSKERDNLRELVKSYKAENTLAPSAAAKQEQESLRAELQASKEEIQKLEEELNKQKEQADKAPEIEDSSKADTLRKVAELEEKVGLLAEEKDQMELRLNHYLARGGFDPAKTRVLQFADNPFAMAVAEKEANTQKLVSENEALKKRIKLMEEGQNVNLTQIVGMELKKSEEKNVAELQEKCETLEKQNKRIVEVFKKTSNDIREVVYRLTGYKIDVPTEKMYKLSHVYAESPDDYLLFGKKDTGELMLMETEFSATLGSLCKNYLRGENPFPAFLSALTLDLAGRQTITESGMSDGRSGIIDRNVDDPPREANQDNEDLVHEVEDNESVDEAQVQARSEQSEEEEEEIGDSEVEDEYNEDSDHSSEAVGGDDEIGSGTDYVEEQREDSEQESSNGEGSVQGEAEGSLPQSDGEGNREEQEGNVSDSTGEGLAEEKGEEDSADDYAEDQGESGDSEQEEEEEGEYEEDRYAEGVEDMEGGYSEEEEELVDRPFKRMRQEEPNEEGSDDDLICLD